MTFRSNLIYNLICQCYLGDIGRIVWVIFGMMYTFRCFKMYYKKEILVCFGGEGMKGEGRNGSVHCQYFVRW